MITKRKLKALLETAKQDAQTNAKQYWNLKKDFDNIKSQLDDYRAKYELLYHTPEYKADTEAAFRRGSNKMRQSLITWLMELDRCDFNGKWDVEDK